MGDDKHRVAYFDCARTGCMHPTRGPKKRKAMGCRLPDLPPGGSFSYEADLDLKKPQGLWRVDDKGRSLPQLEEPSEGCPGSWYRSRFATSFVRYQRPRAEGGIRVANPLITPDTDELILEALRYFEREQEGGEGRYAKERYS